NKTTVFKVYNNRNEFRRKETEGFYWRRKILGNLSLIFVSIWGRNSETDCGRPDFVITERNGVEAEVRMVRRRFDEIRRKAMFKADETNCCHFHCWRSSWFLGSLQTSLWTEDYSAKEPAMGWVWSCVHEYINCNACPSL
ncbi:unnamed protein product, partial [Thlaspi arvense]